MPTLQLQIKPKVYMYIIRSAEIDIVGVYSGRRRAILAARDFAHRQGATMTKVDVITDQLVNIKIIKSDTPVRVWVERFTIK